MRSHLYALTIACLGGCGGKVVFVDDDKGGAEPAETCESVELDQSLPAEICTIDDRCEIRGRLDDDRTVRLVCDDTPACLLFIEGVETCRCPSERIDWASTCPNGVPTCSGWTLDWTDPVFSCGE
jgi:hypothetical protein